MPSNEDRLATQRFALHDVMVGHCGRELTPATVDEITAELFKEVTEGACSWAFKPEETKDA